MSLIFSIIQKCNGCGAERVIAETSKQPEDIKNQVLHGGWRPLGEDVHLCAGCIKQVIKH